MTSQISEAESSNISYNFAWHNLNKQIMCTSFLPSTAAERDAKNWAIIRMMKAEQILLFKLAIEKSAANDTHTHIYIYIYI